MPCTFEWLDDEGADVETTVATVKEVCGTCNGEGKSCAYLGAFGREDFDNDPEFEESYFAGHYDKVCPECNGLRVVDVPTEEGTEPDAWAMYLDKIKGYREYAAERESERRMGC
jgi:hypothetical protein